MLNWRRYPYLVVGGRPGTTGCASAGADVTMTAWCRVRLAKNTATSLRLLVARVGSHVTSHNSGRPQFYTPTNAIASPPTVLTPCTLCPQAHPIFPQCSPDYDNLFARGTRHNIIEWWYGGTRGAAVDWTQTFSLCGTSVGLHWGGDATTRSWYPAGPERGTAAVTTLSRFGATARDGDASVVTV